MSDVATIIQGTNLTRRFGPAAAPVWALRGVSLDVARGERVALLGKSGSGKSTLLNLLGALDRPTEGRIVVRGQELHGMHEKALANYRSEVVGMIFQAFNLVSWRTALDNVALPLVFSGVPRRERLRRATEALVGVGLGERLHHRPVELSGGEQQRVAVARALVQQPPILLADEPTGNLDSRTAEEVMQYLVRDVRERETTLMLVTHDEDLAGACCDRVLRLRDGELQTDAG